MSKTEARVSGGELLLVVTLLACGTALRFWRLDLGWFGVDQARDLRTALDIAAGHDWPTVGPTMRRVTSLGALYYYFWALPHLLSDDPFAAYGFAAGLGVLTLLLTWGFGRRCWGKRAALVTLAILATSPVAVIDGRVVWAPAALPAVAALLLWLLVGASTIWRLAVLGAVLGLAVQLHLTMVAWATAALLLVAGRRPGWRPFLAFGLGCAVTGFPAVYAALGNAGQDAGIATLPSRGPFPDVLGRVEAALALAWRVPAAFWQWSDAPETWPLLARTAGMLIAAAGGLGMVRLAVAAIRRDRVATVVVTVTACQLGMVALLPGEVWYYYLDAALPLWALAAGALVAPPAGAAPSLAGGRALTVAASIVIVAALLLGVHAARWLGASARHGYLVLNPAPLTLDGAGGRDAAAPGRLVTVGVKRALAMALATEPTRFSARWLATHGPAFDDATGDNGFWLLRASSSSATSPSPPATHGALWYRDDPTAPVASAAGFELVDVGPLLLARYRPTIAYDGCRDERGPVVVPIRVLPHPRRYGDGTILRPATLPRRIECAVVAGAGATRIVAAVGAGTVTLHDAAGVSSPAGRTSTLCVRRGEQPASFVIEIALPVGAASDLDLYERPDPDCAAGKIAP